MNPPATLRQITLIGVDLIGGSFALDLKRFGLVRKVVSTDLSRSDLDRALERGMVDEAFDTAGEDNIAAADLVLIVTPVLALSATRHNIAPFLKAGTLVSDVGSTKQSALEASRDCLPGHLPYCIAAHPIAGSDRGGALAAQFGPYQGEKLIITPHGQENSDSLYRLESLWQAVGAKTYRMSAAEHNAVFAAVSHMPHLLAFTFVHQVLNRPAEQTYLGFTAAGSRDFTCIASSHPAIWADICMANKNSLLDLIGGLHVQLGVLKGILETDDRPTLYRYLGKAKQTCDNRQTNQPLRGQRQSTVRPSET